MIIERIRGDEKDLNFSIDLTGYRDKLGSDITDILFLIKADKNDDDDALLIKKMSQSEISKTGTGALIEVSVQWPATDYNNIEIDKKYLAGLFLKFSGDTVFDENSNEEFYVVVYDDLAKQN